MKLYYFEFYDIRFHGTIKKLFDERQKKQYFSFVVYKLL